MKVYAFPDHIQKPELTFPFDYAAYQQREVAASAELKAWLQSQGYTGPNTGEEYGIGHADGAARYMVAEGPSGKPFVLIHLPYGDAWDSPWAARATKADVLKAIAGSKALAAMFAERAAEAQRPIRHRTRAVA